MLNHILLNKWAVVLAAMTLVYGVRRVLIYAPS
jgi:hypothetical protein